MTHYWLHSRMHIVKDISINEGMVDLAADRLRCFVFVFSKQMQELRRSITVWEAKGTVYKLPVRFAGTGSAGNWPREHSVYTIGASTSQSLCLTSGMTKLASNQIDHDLLYIYIYIHTLTMIKELKAGSMHWYLCRTRSEQIKARALHAPIRVVFEGFFFLSTAR